MKRINAQWVFLIILALWIPTLCVADDVVLDKVAKLQQMEELKTIVHEQKQAQEKLYSEPHTLTKIYGIGLVIFGALGGTLAIGIAVSAFWESSSIFLILSPI